MFMNFCFKFFFCSLFDTTGVGDGIGDGDGDFDPDTDPGSVSCTSLLTVSLGNVLTISSSPTVSSGKETLRMDAEADKERLGCN